MSRRNGAATGFLAVAALISGVTVAAAQEARPAPAMGAAVHAVDSVPVADVQGSREELISEVLRMWPSRPGQSTEQLETALRRMSREQLAAALIAGSYDEVNSILVGPQPNALGSPTEDYVYTPVAPCRIFDTRAAGGGGVLAPGGTRDFYTYGTVDISSQGGNAAGCPSPRGEPRAVHINLTAAPVTGPGNIRVYPQNLATPPGVSSVNFVANNIANALTVQTNFAIGPREIQVLASVGTTHVIADVLGYYYDANLTLGSGQRLTGVWGGHFTATAGNQFYYAPISFSSRLATGPASPNANFITGTPTANCPGSNTNPTAAAGQLCAYTTNCSNVTFQCFGSGTSGCSNTASVHGAFLSLQATAAGTVNCWGTWAVTAP